MAVDIGTDKVESVVRAIKALAGTRVLVGIPQEQDDKHPDRPGPIGNAALGYIHENGAPEVGIPPRPWLVPGIASAKDKVAKRLKDAADAALAGNVGLVNRNMHAIGIETVSAVRRYVQSGIAPPLAQATVTARRKRLSSSKYRRKATTASDTTPLIDTADMVKSATYVVEQGSQREAVDPPGM